MANDEVKLEIVNENHKNLSLNDEIDNIFGKPTHPKNTINLLDHERRHDKLNGNNNNVDESDSDQPLQPLLEPDRGRQLPPLAGPEMDDLEGDPPNDVKPYPGIDDGLLEPEDKKPEGNDNDDGETGVGSVGGGGEHTTHSDGVGTDGKWPWEHDEPDYPYDVNGLAPRFGHDDRPVSPAPTAFDVNVNTYQQKKNLAQGMMDLALLSANANQLRYVLESSTVHPYYYSSVTLISLSIIFQILVGVGLILNSQYDVNVHKEICKADKINNLTVLGIFLITIVNVFITSFSVATQTVSVAQQAG